MIHTDYLYVVIFKPLEMREMLTTKIGDPIMWVSVSLSVCLLCRRLFLLVARLYHLSVAITTLLWLGFIGKIGFQYLATKVFKYSNTLHCLL